MITLYYYTNILPMPQAVETPFMRYAPTLLPTVVPLASPAVGTLPVNPTLSYQYLVSFSVEVDDSSYRYRQLMQKPQLVLKFSLPVYVDFPVGTWCVYQNQTYRLNSEKNLTKNGKRNITYQMTLGGDEDNLALYKMRNSVDGRLKYSMCAQPREFIEEIVANLNKREGSSVWSVGECIEATEKTVEFNHCYIDAALQSVADEFETEWEIVNHVISLHKVEYFKENPLPLSYGRGNGFVPGLGRTTNSDEAPIKRIYTQGGTRNIDRSKYGGADSDFPEYETTSAELRLPCSQTLEYEGRTYQTDSQGYYVERIDVVSKAVKEDSLDCSEIYPSRVGRVATVTLGTESNALKDHFYDFTDADTSIPNYNDYLIEGETPTIAFQTGMLAGKEFEFKYDHSQRKFKIVPQEIDGIVMPDPATGYMPRGAEGDYEGDQYIILGVMLPKEYICDNEHKTGASWDMFREAARKLYENEDQKFTFKGELQGLWAKRNWLNVGGYLIVGAYIHFTDEQIAPSGVDIRITGIKDYINSPYAPTIEISNSVSGTSIRTELQKIDNTEVVIDDTYRGVLEFTKRRFRDAKETIEMLEESLLDTFSSSISPIAVQTMALLVGDESLQFQFIGIDNNGNVAMRPDAISYTNTLKQLFLTTPTAGMNIYLKHYTIGIDSIKSEHAETEYRKWKMSSYASAVLTDGTKRYYVYAKCPKEGEGNGEIVMSETAIKMEAVSGYYHFLVGVLNSESDGERSFAPLFGFTEILPGRITTDRIVSSDGNCFLDLVSNAFHIGDARSYVDWNNLVANTLKMNNASISIVNNGGNTMVELNGTDGSGLFAKGNIQWDADGNLKATSGTFTDVLINGSMRCPFRDGYTQLGGNGVITISTHGLHNNNCIVIPGSGSGWLTAFSVPFTSEFNGFRATILNTNWGGTTADGAISASAPSGYYFHEDGEKLGNLVINANEGVEMIGVGEGDTFKGWLILNRFRYGIADSGEGFPLKAIFAGRVVVDSDGKPSLAKQKRYSQDWYDFESKSVYITYNSTAPHYVTVNFPKADAAGTKEIFSSPDNYTVLLSGEVSRTDDGSGVYASVIRKTNNSFTVYTGDDSSFNAGGFTFLVLSTHLWK